MQERHEHLCEASQLEIAVCAETFGKWATAVKMVQAQRPYINKEATAVLCDFIEQQAEKDNAQKFLVG